MATTWKAKCRRCKDTGIRSRGKYDLARCECARTVHQRRTFVFQYFNVMRVGRYKRHIWNPKLTAAEAAMTLAKMSSYARFFGFRSLAAMLKAPVRKAESYGLAGFAVETWTDEVARLVALAETADVEDGVRRAA